MIECVSAMHLLIADRSRCSSLLPAFKQTTATYPLYGLHSNPPLQSPDDWWAKLIKIAFQSASTSPQELDRILPALVPKLIQRFGTDEAYELFPEVESSLAQLKNYRFSKNDKEVEGLRLGLATNSDSRILDALEAFGLEQYLDLSIPSSDSPLPPAAISLPIIARAVKELSDKSKRTGCSSRSGGATLSYIEGVEKPHPEFFKIASKRLFPDENDIDSRSIIYVGDQLQEDYLGSKAAGMSSLWLKRAGEGNRSQPEMEVESSLDLDEVGRNTIRSLKEILERVKKINEGESR